MELLVSRLSPAIMLRASGGGLDLLNVAETAPPRDADAASAFLRYLAVPTAAGVRVLRGPSAIEGVELSEPWIVVWFGQSSPARAQDQDCPLLVVLQHRPSRVRLDERQGLSLRFTGDTGYVALLALAGFANVQASQSEKWSAGLPESMVQRARQWAPLVRHYPTDVKESYHVDHAADRVTVREEVTFLSTEDDWKTPPRKLAPLPPVLAAAWRHHLPLTFSGPVVDLKHIENVGPYAGIADVDHYTWQAAVLLKYEREAMQVGKPPAQAASLRKALTSEIQKMLQAGHLRAGYFAGGLLDSSGAGAWDFWVNPGELVKTLSQASPVWRETRLPSRRTVKEIASYPP
jgi:hypothetical protein